MKKIIPFLLVFAVCLGFAGFAYALTLGNPLGDITFAGLICKIFDYVFGLIAALAGLMFVIAGIFYVTSAGDPAKIKRAKDMLVYAIIGTAIALAATGLIDLIASIIGATSSGCVIHPPI